nr:hypothetical protein [Tanacetum cinerariifolium]
MSSCFRDRCTQMLLEHQDVILKFCSPFRQKDLSKETSSKILPDGDVSCRKMVTDIKENDKIEAKPVKTEHEMERA